MKKPEKPTPRYKNLLDLKSKMHYCYSGVHEWPCLECSGYGKIYDPNDPPCSYEGSRHRDRIKCPHCGGSGAGKRTDYVLLLSEYKKEHNTKMEHYKAEMKLYNSIKKKLTKKEWEYLTNGRIPRNSKSK
jgi:hypothetical protein